MAYKREAASRKQLSEQEQRISQLERIIQISQKLNTTLELDALLGTITQAATELTETEGCAILLLDRETGELVFRVATAPNSTELVGRAVPLNNSIAGHILLNQAPLLIHDVRQDPRHFRDLDRDTAYETRSLVGVPLQVRGKAIGVLEAVNKQDDLEMTWADVEVLAILADQAAVAIDNARLYRDIRRIKEFNEDLVQGLAEGVVVTDDMGRVSFVNPALARLVGYTSDELIGRHWTTIIPSDQHSIVEAAFERRLRGESDRYKLELLRSDGSRTPVVVSGSPRRDLDTGQVFGSVAVFTDITQALARQRMEQELDLAWQIQSSFLPHELPKVPGWQLAASLKPARQTSGDFFDLVPLLNGRLGVLIADVAGKGMGAALYMAVSRTLLRTYAIEYHEQPELALRAANRRLLSDTRADIFITAFLGVIDPFSGTMIYCNAGHNPPYLLRGPDGTAVQAMPRTGLPLGTFEDLTWEQKTVQLVSGDVLLFYTDGITDAEDERGRFFGSERLLDTARSNMTRPASAIHDALIGEVEGFIENAPHGQRDDIALAIVVRGSPQ